VLSAELDAVAAPAWMFQLRRIDFSRAKDRPVKFGMRLNEKSAVKRVDFQTIFAWGSFRGERLIRACGETRKIEGARLKQRCGGYEISIIVVIF